MGRRDGCTLEDASDVLGADLTGLLPSRQQALNLRVLENRCWQFEGRAGRHELPLVGVLAADARMAIGERQWSIVSRAARNRSLASMLRPS